MKKQVMAEATSPEIKRELHTEVRELEQQVQIFEKREKKLNGSPPTVKILKPRRVWSKDGR